MTGCMLGTGKRWTVRDALFKMKEVWFYLGKMFPEAERELKKVKKADRPEEYLAAVRSVFTLPVHALQ